MHQLVKILFDDDGEKVDSPTWCLVTEHGDASRTLCTGEVFGYGEGSAIYEQKSVEKGVPCPRCREIVKWFKAIKL